jgi:hypothetical protein
MGSLSVETERNIVHLVKSSRFDVQDQEPIATRRRTRSQSNPPSLASMSFVKMRLLQS